MSAWVYSRAAASILGLASSLWGRDSQVTFGRQVARLRALEVRSNGHSWLLCVLHAHHF